MIVIFINNKAGAVNSLVMDCLRTGHIAQGNGAAVVRTADELARQVEKLIHGVAIPAGGAAFEKLPWKKNPLLIVDGQVASTVMPALEKLVPGITKALGPVHTYMCS